MPRPITDTAIAALGCAAHAQSLHQSNNHADPQPARYAVDATLIPANRADVTTRGFGPSPVSTAFTYQGVLEDNGAPANAPYDMNFVLVNEFGNPVAAPVCVDNVAVTSGIFTVQLDFGPQFTGQARALAIAVRPGGAAGDCASGFGFTPLTPDQPITATPYALGLRLPFDAFWPGNGGSIFTITDTSTTGLAAIRGIRGAPIDIPFVNFLSAVRGDATGQLNIGVLGVTDEGYGLAAYAEGDGATGVFASAFGTNARAIDAVSSGPGGIGIIAVGGPGGYAASFNGRSSFFGNVGVNTADPAVELDVLGDTRTVGLQVLENAGQGRTLVSDAEGNATWTATDSEFRSSNGNPVPGTQGFVSTSVLVTVNAGQRVHVTASQSLGSSVPSGGTGLSLWIGYRQPGGTLVTVGGGVFGLTVPQNQRQLFTLSAIIENLAPGTYEFGLVGSSNNGASWNNNEWGYVTAFTLN